MGLFYFGRDGDISTLDSLFNFNGIRTSVLWIGDNKIDLRYRGATQSRGELSPPHFRPRRGRSLSGSGILQVARNIGFTLNIGIKGHG